MVAPTLAQVEFSEVFVLDDYKIINFSWTQPPPIPATTGDEENPGTEPNEVNMYKIYFQYAGGLTRLFQSDIQPTENSLTVTLDYPLAPGIVTFFIQTIDIYDTSSPFGMSDLITVPVLAENANKFAFLNVTEVTASYTVSPINATQDMTIRFKKSLVGTDPDRDYELITHSVYDINNNKLGETTFTVQANGEEYATITFTLPKRLGPSTKTTYNVRSMITGNANAQSETDGSVDFMMDKATTPISGLNVTPLPFTATYSKVNLTQNIILEWEANAAINLGVGPLEYNIYNNLEDAGPITTVTNTTTEVLIEKRLRSFATKDFFIEVVATENPNIFSEKHKVTYRQPIDQIDISNGITTLNVRNLQVTSSISQEIYVNSQTLRFTCEGPANLENILGSNIDINYILFKDNNPSSIGAGITTSTADDPAQRTFEIIIGRLPPGNNGYSVQLVVRSDSLTNIYSNIFSERVPVNVVMYDILDLPTNQLSINSVNCELDDVNKTATFTWTNPLSLRDPKYQYDIFRTITKSPIATIDTSDSDTLTYETPNADNNIVITSQLSLRAVEKLNSNVYSDVVKFNIILVCLLKGTLVKTQDSYVPIEDLKVGDVVLNHKQEPTKITKVIHINLSYIENPIGREVNTVVYKIPAGQYGATKDVFLTHHHKFLANGKMVKPVDAGLTRAKPEEFCDENNKYSVYHLRLEDEYNNHFIVNGDCIVEDWYEWVKSTPPELLE